MEKTEKSFTRPEAQGKVGKVIRTSVEFSGVPKGSRGKVVRADESSDGWSVGIEWELGPRTKPLVDWFSRDEYERFLTEET